MDYGRFNYGTLGRCGGMLRGAIQSDCRNPPETEKREGGKREGEKMSLIPEKEAELIRLKFKLELIRTVCPLVAIALQILILVRIF